MNLKILLILSLWFASVNSVAKTEIDGAFGVKFGDVWTLDDMKIEWRGIQTETGFGFVVAEFIPKKILPGFDNYRVAITPISNKVFQIEAKNNPERNETVLFSCRNAYRETLLYLKDLYGDNFTEQDESKYDYNYTTLQYTSGEGKYETGGSSIRIKYFHTDSSGCSLELYYFNELLAEEGAKEKEILRANKRANKFKGIDL